MYCKISRDIMFSINTTILPTKTTAARNEDALSYLKVRGLYYLAVVFVATILYILMKNIM